MNPSQFVTLLGMTNSDESLIEGVKANGGSVSTISAKKMKEILSDFVVFNEIGVTLAFVPREAFKISYCDPRGDGDYVMDGVFYFPNGSSSVLSYKGSIPFANGPVQNRDEAISAFGSPEFTEEEDGEIYWDIWRQEGLRIKVDYRDGGAVKTVLFSIPRKN